MDDWEGRVNAWPLDEGLIDYVAYGGATDENPYAGLNVIANAAPMIGGAAIDASAITPALITDTLNEADGIETNVARGYHAIEFLLWGQDLNGTGPGAGNRPATDYATGDACTGGHCDRRAAYLAAASDVLIADLEEMVANWTADGATRQALLADPDAGVIAMLTGMGSLSYGEQAASGCGLAFCSTTRRRSMTASRTTLTRATTTTGLAFRTSILAATSASTERW